MPVRRRVNDMGVYFHLVEKVDIGKALNFLFLFRPWSREELCFRLACPVGKASAYLFHPFGGRIYNNISSGRYYYSSPVGDLILFVLRALVIISHVSSFNYFYYAFPPIPYQILN